MEHKIFKLFENRSPIFWTVINIILISALGFVDYLTGNEYSFSLFYLLPISLTAWFASKRLGTFIAILCALTWLAADLSVGENYTHPIIYFWNTLIRFGIFYIVSYLITELRKSQNAIEALAFTDHITGTVNSRHFQKLLEIQLERAQRNNRPFTLVYLDLDNFKLVNDRFGHGEGDILIKDVSDTLKGSIRSTDTVSRLGGDEFAILFPDAGQQEAEVVMNKINTRITERLGQKYSFVSFSAGAVTYIAAPTSSSETIKIADDLMYSVKKSTKNSIRYSVYPD